MIRPAVRNRAALEARQNMPGYDAQPYLCGAHLEIEEPHIYVDIMDLVETIRADRPPRATGEQARHVVEIIEKARIAAHIGQTQDLVSVFAPL